MDQISNFNESLDLAQKQMCDKLRVEIDKSLSKSSSKLYHGSPVWFLDDNPTVGYSIKKAGVSLLFWSGQSFKEPGLRAVGKFKAAEIVFTQLSEIDVNKVALWLTESQTNIWDYKNLPKNQGALIELKELG